MSLEKVQIPIYNSIVINGKESLIENQDYFTLKDEYLSYINDYRENPSDQFIGGMPVQLQKNCLSQLLRGTSYEKLIYGITLKVNGVRHLFFLSKTGVLYFIDRVTNFYYFKRPDNSVVSFKPTEFPFLFDGELVLHKNGRFEFLVFDVIMYMDRGKNYNWMSNNYYDRLYIMDKAINKDLTFMEFDVTLKTWFPIETIKQTSNIYKYVIDKTNETRSKKPRLEEDGLILQPFDGNYIPFREWNVFNNVQFKWKPPQQLTIDFKIKLNPENRNEWWLLTKSDQNYDVKQPDGTTIHAVIIPTKSDRENYNEGDVLECKLKERSNPQRNIFVPILKRADKTEGNSLQTIMSTLDVVENPFTLDILKPAILSILSGENIEETLQFYSLPKMILCSVNMFFSESEIMEIKKIYEVYFENPKIYELEFRVYPYIKKGKKESIQKFTYYYFLDFLKKSGMKMVHEFSIDTILNNQNKTETYRSSYSDFSFKNPVNLVKRKVADYRLTPTSNIFPLTLKLNLSTETSSPIKVGLKNQLHDKVVYNTIRIKDRNSFLKNPWRIDITKIITTMNINSSGIETYEIECEYIGEHIPFQTFIESMNQLYKTILYNTTYC